MKFLEDWNLLTLVGALAAPLAALLVYLGWWETIMRHGPGRGDATVYRAGLATLVACGVLGLLTLRGVGDAGGERTGGRPLAVLLVVTGAAATLLLGRELWTHGLWPS